jgi:cytochrome P450
MIGREAIRDTTLLGVRIPAGTLVQVQLWALNRSKNLWGEDAREFNPDRWLVGDKKCNGGADDALSMATFGHGPRGCIGKGLYVVST